MCVIKYTQSQYIKGIIIYNSITEKYCLLAFPSISYIMHILVILKYCFEVKTSFY